LAAGRFRFDLAGFVGRVPTLSGDSRYARNYGITPDRRGDPGRIKTLAGKSPARNPSFTRASMISLTIEKSGGGLHVARAVGDKLVDGADTRIHGRLLPKVQSERAQRSSSLLSSSYR